MSKLGTASLGRLSADETEARLVIVADYYLKGKPQHEIAEKLQCTISVIYYYMGILRERWVQRSLMAFTRRRAQELAKIDFLESQYWAAFERSVKDSTYKSRRYEFVPKSATPLPGNAANAAVEERRLVEESERTEQRLGDPRYLEGVRWCIEARCKLMGLFDQDVAEELNKMQDNGEDARRALKEKAMAVFERKAIIDLPAKVTVEKDAKTIESSESSIISEESKTA